MNEDIQKLFEAGEFSQEFKDSATAIFESAVEDRVAQIAEDIEKKYSNASEVYAEYVMEELQEKYDEYIAEEISPIIDRYLQYSVDEFVKENKLAIESGVKIELAESFLKGITNVAESFNVVVPEGADDVVTKLETSLAEMQTRFDTVLEEKEAVEAKLQEQTKSTIIDAKIVDLTESQKEKFTSVASKIDFRNVEQFTSAVDDLFESYHPIESKSTKTEDKTTVTKITETVNPSLDWLNKV